jgi:hypothetical protein
MPPTTRFDIRVTGQQTGRNSGEPTESARQLVYVLLMIPGVFITLQSFTVYRPVDRRLPMVLMLSVFLLPVLFHVLSFMRTQPDEKSGNWRLRYVCSGFALILLGGLLFLNGGLDQSSQHVVQTTILAKTALSGRNGRQYDLAVSSWRPRRDVEHFNVTETIFKQAVVGKSVIVAVHDGFFGLPWYHNISLQ